VSIFFLDYEGGSDAADGLTFPNRWKTITAGATAARIAPGDTIRVMGSPAPTLVGNGTWTNGPLAARYALAGALFSNTTPIKVSYIVSYINNGDTVIVDSVVGNTSANGVWIVSNKGASDFELLNADGSASVGNGTGSGTGGIRNFTNSVVTLASAVTANIAECGNRGVKPNWTASANVTCAKSTADFKEGGECQQIAVAAAFTTGLAAYFPTGTLNLSDYQQVSFWIKQTVGTLGAASSISLALCSDIAGVTAVNTVNIPALGAINQWSPIKIDLATALGSSIQSIALYVNTDNAAQTFLIDNVIACKASSSADSLNLTSLISKDPGDHTYGDGYECWFGLQSINKTRVVLDGIVNTIPAASPQRGYAGATETVSTYMRETIKTPMAANTTVGAHIVQDFGALGSLISFSGGWDRTDMSTKTLESWFDGQNGFGICVVPNTKAFTAYDRIHGARYTNVFSGGVADSDQTIIRMDAANCSSSPVITTGNRLTATTLSAVCCGGAITPGTGSVVQTIGRSDSSSVGNGLTTGNGSQTLEVKQANNNFFGGVISGISSYIRNIFAANGNNGAGYSPGARSVCELVTANYNTSNGINFGSSTNEGALVLGGSSVGNAFSGIGLSNASGTIRNFTINEAAEVSGYTGYHDGRVYSENHDGIAGNVKIFCDGGLIGTVATPVHGSSSLAWKFSPTSANRSQYYPLNQSIAKVACGASTLVTVSAWFQRSNTGLTGNLVCKGGQIAGVASAISETMTAAANTWEQLTITFTPSEAGVVEIESQFYGGTTYNGYVCDMSISQA
jgi:hypothetical protein